MTVSVIRSKQFREISSISFCTKSFSANKLINRPRSIFVMFKSHRLAMSVAFEAHGDKVPNLGIIINLCFDVEPISLGSP